MSDFESPSSLSNREISTLQKESKAKELSFDMKKILSDPVLRKKFEEEHISYLKRSKNPTSKKWVDKMFKEINLKFEERELTTQKD